MRQISLQRTTTDNRGHAKLEHLDPWVILDDKGTVQDEELTLVGFVKQIPFKHLDVDFQTFFANPYMAVGRNAVFADKHGEWSGDPSIITDAIVTKEQ